MSANRNHLSKATRPPVNGVILRAPLSSEEAELLLAGEPVADRLHLAELIAAVTRPPTAEELVGQDTALAAFTTARHPAPARPPTLRRTLKSVLTKIVTIKAAALVMSVGGVGGVALAARTGHLPEPVQRHLPGAVANAPHRTHPPDAGGQASGQNRSPSPDPLRDLCHRYLDRDRESRGTALASGEEFAPLTRRAGSRERDQVDRFCGTLGGPVPGPHPSGSPEASASASRPGGTQPRPSGFPPRPRPTPSTSQVPPRYPFNPHKDRPATSRSVTSPRVTHR